MKQVQWQRGFAVYFADIMLLNEPESSTSQDSKDFQSNMRPPLDLNCSVASTPGPNLQAPQVIQILGQLFDVKTVLRLSQSEKVKTFRLLNNAMAVEARGGLYGNGCHCSGQSVEF